MYYCIPAHLNQKVFGKLLTRPLLSKERFVAVGVNKREMGF